MFDALSTELIVVILGHLHYIQLIRCREICKRFQAIIDNTPALQYTIELSAAGYAPERATTEGILRDLETFRTVQRAYRDPHFHSVKKLSLSFCGPRLHDGEWRGWSMFGDTLACLTEDGMSVGVISLRSDVPEDKRFWRHDFPFSTNSLHIDESRDLLVLADLFTETVRFRSLTTGEVHEDVQWESADGERGVLMEAAVLDWSFWGDWMLYQDDRDQDMNDSVLASCMCSNMRTTCLYHWPTGKVVKKWNAGQADSGCLVEGHVVLATRSAEPMEEYFGVYPIPPRAPQPKEEVPLLACYHLPLRKDTNRHLDLDLKSIGPKASYLNVQTHTHSGFKQVNADSLLLFYSDIFPIYISVPALVMDRRDPAEDNINSTSSSKPVHIPWEDWGPQNTRSLWLYSPEDKPLLGTSGMRLVFADHIFDFNAYDIAHNLYGPSVTPVARRLRTTGTNYSGEVHMEASDVQAQPFFYEEQDPLAELYMSTSMPYRQTRLGLRAYDDYNKGMYLVEEEDGPKIVKFECNAKGAPKFLRWYAL